MAKDIGTAKTKELTTTVGVKKLVIDSGNLNIATKHGTYHFWANEVKQLPIREAEELIKVRTKQRGDINKAGCDLLIVED